MDTFIVAYYKGAYGQTLRIDIRQYEELVSFRKIISDLVSGKTKEFSICQYKVPLDDLKDLVLKVSDENEKCAKKLTYEANTFIWECIEEEWETVLGLLQPFVENNLPGHQ